MLEFQEQSVERLYRKMTALRQKGGMDDDEETIRGGNGFSKSAPACCSCSVGETQEPYATPIWLALARDVQPPFQLGPSVQLALEANAKFEPNTHNAAFGVGESASVVRESPLWLCAG